MSNRKLENNIVWGFKTFWTRSKSAELLTLRLHSKLLGKLCLEKKRSKKKKEEVMVPGVCRFYIKTHEMALWILMFNCSLLLKVKVSLIESHFYFVLSKKVYNVNFEFLHISDSNKEKRKQRKDKIQPGKCSTMLFLKIWRQVNKILYQRQGVLRIDA